MVKKTKIANVCKNVALGACNTTGRGALRMAFGAVCALGTAVYHGFDPAHLTLSYGIASAITGFGAVVGMNAASIAIISTLGAFGLTRLTLAGVQAYKEGGDLGYLAKKMFNTAAACVTGGAAFVAGSVGGMIAASKLTNAEMYLAPANDGVMSGLFNGILGRDSAETVATTGPYDWAEISDAFEHFNYEEIDAGDVVLGTAEVLGQFQATVLTGIEEACKSTGFIDFMTSPGLAAAAIAFAGAAGACFVAFKGTSYVLDKITGATIKSKSPSCDHKMPPQSVDAALPKLSK
jgi:hypothetical protein